MKTLTSDKLTIVGAAGMIGSNIAQSAIIMRLSSNICLYDPYVCGLEGVAEELLQCAFSGVNITYTSNIEDALRDSKYIITSGGAARKEGMTREDLLKGNAEIAIQFGKDVKQYCPDVKHITVIFNPTDITGLLVLLYSGLKSTQVSTLAALDSTRLRNELAKHFRISPDKVFNCRTYGGHGEQMAVFSSTATIDGKPLNELIGTPELTDSQWLDLKNRVIQGGKRIMELRGRSSFQSPAYLSLAMMRAVMGGESFNWPVGVYLCKSKEFSNIMMAMETRVDTDGVHYKEVKGTMSEEKDLRQSYIHLCELRDQLIYSGVIPSINEWKSINSNM